MTMKEMVGGCCVCSDDRGWDENPLVYCDGHGCNVAVHQACYGIVEVPKGPWFCRKCESQERAARVRCELCPQRTGALKRSDLGGWCHVVCALFIPEAWFLNVQTMEPIVLKSVPPERFSKVCYVCDENKMESKATQGACMQCNKPGCKNHFHVTCAQAHGLLCEEAGSNGDSVKYCGYCIYHYKKLKKDSHIKQIPAFKLLPSEARTPDSSPDKSLNENGEGRSKCGSGGAVKTKAETRHVSPSTLSTPTALPLEPEPLHSSPQSDSAWKLSTLKSRALHEQKLTLEAKRAAAASSSLASPPVLTSSNPVASPSLSTTSHATNHVANHTAAVASNSAHPNPALDASSSPPKSLASPPTSSPSPGLGSPPNITGSTKFDKFRTSPMSESTMETTDNSQDNSSVAKRKQAKAAEKAEKRAAKKRRKAQKRRDDEASKVASTPGSPVIDPVSYTAMPILTAENGALVTSATPTTNVLTPPTASQSVFGGEPIFHSLSQHPVNVHSFTKPECEARIFDGTTSVGVRSPPPAFTSLATTRHKRDVTAPAAGCDEYPTTFEQLLERHWDQGNQFLMSQAADFDIGSLLTCLQQLRVENQRLAHHVKSLNERRDHLSSVNVKLASSLRPPSEPNAMGDGSRTHRLSSSSDSSVKSQPHKAGGGAGKLPTSRPSSAHQTSGTPRAPSPTKNSRKTSSASPDIRLASVNSNPIITNALQLPPLTDQQRAHFFQQQTNNILQRSLDTTPPFLYPVLTGPRGLPHRPPVSIISAMHSYPVSNSMNLAAPLHMTAAAAPADLKGKEKA